MPTLFKKIISFFFIVSGLFLFAHLGFAQEANDTLGMGFGEETGLGSADPRIVAANIVRIFLAFLGVIAVSLIVYAGFLWMTSEGNAEKVEKAKNIIKAAIIGLLIVLSAFAIASFIISQLLDATTSTGGGGNGDGGGIDIPGGGIGGGGTSCDGNPVTDVCEADKALCGEGEYCATSTCSCQSVGGLGASCDEAPQTDTCQANNNMCKEYLECSPEADCTCQGAPVIENVTPVGGFCKGDVNTFCESDDDCSASSCATSTPSGAPGNLVTISGQHFGTSTGSVHFSDGSGFNVEAVMPNEENPDCDSNWTGEQIIVIVPEGAADGPIRVTRTDGEDDTTSNDRGPSIPAFVINNIERPGLCKLKPTQGQAGDTLSYFGLNLTNSIAYFGEEDTAKESSSSSFSSPLEGTGEVPLIQAGETTTFVKKSSKGSNYLDFVKEKEPEEGPAINYFTPTKGPPGQYVTIYGQGFGDSRAGQTVYFGDEVSGKEASFDFPQVCGDSTWTDEQVVVKVPSDVTNSEYIITMALNTETITSAEVVPTEGHSPTFRSDDSLPLAPGLCKIEPVMGPTNIPISLWGEYFGENKDTVKFYSDVTRTDDAINYWGTDGDAQRVDTTIPSDAVSGPVQIVKDGTESNGMNLEVGKCTEAENPNQACGEQVCCPQNTYKGGRCADSPADCSMDIQTSVYEWEFDTGGGGGEGDPCYIDATTTPNCNPVNGPCGEGLECEPDSCVCEPEESPYDNCEQRSQTEGNCDPVICPNSPGQCSPYDIGECSPDCSTLTECDSGECSYTENLDNCTIDGSSCDLSTTTQETLGGQPQTFTQYCDTHNGTTTYWHIDTNTSCPNGWTNIGDGTCIDEGSANSCSLCDSGVCKETESGSVCAIDQNMCDDHTSSVCECCCRIDQGGQDCCSFQVPEGYTAPAGFDLGEDGYLSLMCDGNCGSDATGEDTNTYGRCSGCRIEDESGNVDQKLSDQACNCGDTSGKYCDVGADPDNDGEPEGVCQDCTVLNSESCSDHHSTCCVDAMEGEQCRGGKGSFGLSNAEDSDLAYCEYHQCNDSGDACDTSTNPVASSSNAVYASSTTCMKECTPAPSFGKTCAYTATNTDACKTEICPEPFGCLSEDGSGPLPSDDCGICCCDPNASPDPCTELSTDNQLLTKSPYLEEETSNLECQPDRGNCTSDTNDRGLCCGCEADRDCGDVSGIGCGNDNCCHARPGVTTTTPINENKEVCANIEISAEFDQRMKISSFTGNVVVAGEYEGQCPKDTEYVAGADSVRGEEKDSLFASINNSFHAFFDSVVTGMSSFFGGENVRADIPSENKNYCAVSGSTSGEHTADGNTRLTFSPNKLLDTNRKYFVIIKGDEDLNSETGVQSQWSLGMNGDTGSSNSTPISDPTLNGVTYDNAYAWSFVTMKDQGNNGACAIDHVKIDPSSYLFQTTDDDNNENDDPNNGSSYPDASNTVPSEADNSFDSARDRDKVFVAQPLNKGGQTLTPVAGYNWDWDWSVDNDSVVSTDSPDNPYHEDFKKQLVQAQPDIANKKTKVRAEVVLDTTEFNTKGGGEEGVSDVRVFLCDNPWPSINDDGSWTPWQDEMEGSSGDVGDGTYYPELNFQMYYCRDQGGENTVDDLPAITEEGKVRACETPPAEDSCSYYINNGLPFPSGTTLKEIFFFREDIPGISGLDLSASAPSSGNTVELNWTWENTEGVDTGKIKHYKIYYGTSQGPPYGSSETTDNDSTGPLILEGLTNGTTYYFTVTAVYDNGAESNYSEEVSVMVEDEQGPNKPNIQETTIKNSNIKVNWEDQSDGEAVSFKFYYTASDNCASSLNFGNSITEPYSAEATTTISGLSPSTAYCVGVAALDESGNESDIETINSPISIPTTPEIENVSANYSTEDEVKIKWSDTSDNDALSFNIYYVASDICSPSLDFDNSITESYSDTATTTISGLSTSTSYCLGITSENNNGDESIIETIDSPISIPTTPTINGISTTENSVDVNWSDTSGNNTLFFNVYYTTSDSCSSSLDFGNSITAPYSQTATTTISGLSPSTDYCVSITSENEFGEESGMETLGVTTTE